MRKAAHLNPACVFVMNLTMSFRSSILVLSAFFGGSAVLLAAAAAHLPSLAEYSRAIIERASFYQLIHAGMLFVIALHYSPRLRFSAGCFMIGILAFCGGIYLRHLAGIELPSRVVPMGGIAFTLGWLGLLLLVPRLHHE